MKFSAIQPADGRDASIPGAGRLPRRPVFRTSAHMGHKGRKGHPPLDEYYNSLFTAFGPQHWWPGETQFEVIVGAILTQNTSWRNVETAIGNLRRENLLSPQAIERTHGRKLERLIHSSGYFRQKARKLKE